MPERRDHRLSYRIIGGLALLSVTLIARARADEYDKYDTEARRSKGLIVVVPEAEGGEQAKRNLVEGLADSGVPYAIHVFRWGHPVSGVGPFGHHTSPAGNRKAAERLARGLADYQKQHTGVPAFAVGHGAGGGIAVLSLEALAGVAGSKPITGAFLFAPSISADYDLTRALSRVHLGIINVYNCDGARRPRANVDGGSGASAGTVGFKHRDDRLFDLEFEGPKDGADPHDAVTHPGYLARHAPAWLMAHTWPPEGERAGEPAGRLKPEPETPPADKAGALAREKPAEFLKLCLKEGPSKFSDYRCIFIQNQRLDGKLTGRQRTEVRYRRQPLPRAVYMIWLENPGSAKRCLWIDGRNLSKHGEQQVRVQPTGLAGRFVSDISLPLSDKRVKESSRQPITEYGATRTLERIIRENDTAAREGVLDLKFQGEGVVDGRPTFILVRQLPYAPNRPKYSDGRMVLHVDQEWLVPVSIYSYADHQGKTLLESFEIIRLEKDVGLTDSDFQF